MEASSVEGCATIDQNVENVLECLLSCNKVAEHRIRRVFHSTGRNIDGTPQKILFNYKNRPKNFIVTFQFQFHNKI